MRELERLGIAYTVARIDTSDGAIDGLSVAAKEGRDPQVVFKTLACRGHSGAPVVFCIPVAQTLDLKAAARAAGEKSVAMLPLAELLPTTGYRHGGCSPLGMKKHFATYLEASAQTHERILVSAGQVGVQVELAPADLLRAARAQWFTNG
jgi:Cys-tRNA(Pro)/Cys-tRNA(Cys) deacylase